MIMNLARGDLSRTIFYRAPEQNPFTTHAVCLETEMAEACNAKLNQGIMECASILKFVSVGHPEFRPAHDRAEARVEALENPHGESNNAWITIRTSQYIATWRRLQPIGFLDPADFETVEYADRARGYIEQAKDAASTCEGYLND